MSCGIKNEKELIAVKKRILERNHLKAVLSMPDELFNPTASVVTCIMVFEANKKHEGRKTWFGYFKDDIFEIKNSKSLELINCEEVENGICFISRTSANNGVVARVKQLDDLEPMPANAITVALGGSVLSSFYQEEPFYTAFHIACLYPKIEMSKEEMQYYCAIIELNKYRYNFGRQANKTLKSILVPLIKKT